MAPEQVAEAHLVNPQAPVAGPLMLVAAWRRGPTARRDIVVGGGLAAALVMLAYAPFFRGLETFQGLQRGSIFSASPGELLVIGLEGAGWPLDRAMAAARTLAGGAFVALSLVAILALWRGRLELGTTIAAVLFLYLLVGSQWFNPWYLLWLLPVAVVAPSWQIRALALTFAVLAPLTYLLQYDARLIVPIVFVPVALLAVRLRAALGWSQNGPSAPRAPLGAPRMAGRG